MELDFTAARIRQIMTARPRTVRRTTSVQMLRRLFVEYGFNAFPVVDDIDTLSGIVTVTPGDPLAAAMDRMLASRLRSVPVVDRERGRERLVGIVSCGHVLRAVTFETRDAG